MLDSTINLVKADIKDIELIAKLAKVIWHEYYPSIISIKQINYMLKKMYTSDSIAEQMQKNDTFYLIYINHEPQGFISINNIKDNSYFLSKFYIVQTTAAKGKGTRAFKQLLSTHR